MGDSTNLFDVEFDQKDDEIQTKDEAGTISVKVSSSGKQIIELARKTLIEYKQSLASLNELANRVYPIIQSCARGLAGRYTVDSEDLCQESWERFLKIGIDRYDPEADFRSFIVGITMRVAQEMRKSRRDVCFSDLDANNEREQFGDVVSFRNNGGMLDETYEIAEDEIDRKRAQQAIIAKIQKGRDIPYATEISEKLRRGEHTVTVKSPLIGQTTSVVVAKEGQLELPAPNKSAVVAKKSKGTAIATRRQNELMVDEFSVQGVKSRTPIAVSLVSGGLTKVVVQISNEKSTSSTSTKKTARTPAHDEFRDIRLKLNMSRKEYAAALGVNRYLVDSYEYARTADVNSEVLEAARALYDNMVDKDYELSNMLANMSMSEIALMWAKRLGIDHMKYTEFGKELNKTATTIRRWLANLARPKLDYLIKTHKAVFSDRPVLAARMYMMAFDELKNSTRINKTVIFHHGVYDRLQASASNMIKHLETESTEMKFTPESIEKVKALVAKMDMMKESLPFHDDEDNGRYYSASQAVIDVIKGIRTEIETALSKISTNDNV